ncbi:uncharacterized protein CG3556-like [Uloborus diversus]|uniref:uncharacterized protein CG3556-like n=1 Tax=Uloborus diversus TaxID=327109 RepID=UPI00240A121E|nr:uncharacterized protein CG3556-like [Uloborus diversus]
MDGARKSRLIWSALVFFFLPTVGSCFCVAGKSHCANGKCIPKPYFCDGENDCSDNSDELFCRVAYAGRCPDQWIFCEGKCFPEDFRCDGTPQCRSGIDEEKCVRVTERPRPVSSTTPRSISTRNAEVSTSSEKPAVHEIIGVNKSKWSLRSWFLSRRKNGTTSNKWGHELHRTATALYLSNSAFFAPGNLTGQEMAYELTIQLLSKFSENETLSSEDLALYINALLVTCIDPRDFHGHDLVSDLRKRVEGEKYTNPIEIIALCNAGDTMTAKDVERISTAYNSQHRPFWIDIQALSALAMVCLSRLPTLTVDQRNLRDMVSELKKRQHLNGTVENLKTTAVVLQVLTATNSSRSDFDYEAAVKAILQQQKSDGAFPTFLESYYILPALSNNSLVGLNTSHCQNSEMTEQEALKKFRSQGGKRIQVQYSVFVGQDVDFARTWKLKVPLGSTLYNVMETIQKLDPRFRVEYNVFDGKPYPNAMFNLEDDPESGLYWFVYKRSSRSNDPQLLEASPVDIKIRENEELILWYKYEDWDDRETTQSVTPATEPPTSTATTSSPFTDATVDYITDASLIQ